MVDLVFPLSSAPGARPQEGAGRLINAFTERASQGAAGDTIIRRCAGLQRVAETTSHSHTRGFLDVSSHALWILDERVYSVDEDFNLVNVGALTGTLPVITARNNNATPQNVAVTENGAFNLFTASPPTAFADVDLPANPTSVTFIGGYFVFTFGDGRIFASDINSVSVASNSTVTEQGLVIRRGIEYAGRFYAFGDKWTAVYRNAGLSPFPLVREVTIPRGIIGSYAIAGLEVGWTNEPIFVGDNGVVYRLNGYSLLPISTDDVNRDIQAAVAAEEGHLLEASVYMHRGNAVWALTWAGHWTWEFNLTTGLWNERRSYSRTDWRGRRGLRMFNRWLIGDAATGKLFEVSGSYFREDTDALIWHVESGVLHSFPRGLVIPQASFHLTTATGDVDLEEDPKVLISWSLDGGFSYGIPVLRRFGGPGESRFSPSVLSCGLSRGQGVRFRLVVSDPVHVGLMGGAIDVEKQSAA